MNSTRILTALFTLMMIGFSVQAQIDEDYVGYWVLKGGVTSKDKCAKDQVLELKADGTAVYYYGANAKNCEPVIMEYDEWRIVKKKVLIEEPTLKDIVLDRTHRTIVGLDVGNGIGIRGIVKKKNGPRMTIIAEVPEGDTTTEKELTFLRRKEKK